MIQDTRNKLIINVFIFVFFYFLFNLSFLTRSKAEQGLPEKRQGPVFTIKVTMSSVNIRQGPGTSYMWIATVKKNDLLSTFEEKDGWFHCKTPDGKEGWIIASACRILPVRSESALSELRHVITNCEATQVRAGPVDTYPALGLLSMDKEVGMYLEEAEWIYVKENKEGLEGWIKKKCVYDPKKNINLNSWKNEALLITEKLSNYYDQKKKETRAHQDAGWYPSFSVFLREKDIAIEPLPDGWRLDLALSLRRISMETFFPLPEETIPIKLLESDRLFLLTLFQTLTENDTYNEVKIRLKGLKKKSGSLKWTEAESYTLKRSDIEGKDLDIIDTNKFWDLLIHNKN
jgi:SH3-like domain-containing protein